ncbi:MAG: NAD(P)H-hydrate dehydratase [Saprospiraceae bacterium]|nr:NAD(P)H-hydrate dehydratase [Saprospiraceae bacterium]
MYLYNAAQFRAWDKYTMDKHGISSLELMERAGSKISEAIMTFIKPDGGPVHVFCGMGNNGGDGLVVARKLRDAFFDVHVYECLTGSVYSPEYLSMRDKMAYATNIQFHPVSRIEELIMPEEGTIIDALFGIGINKPLSGLSRDLVHHINNCGLTVVSIDVPSGMGADLMLPEFCVKAAVTLTVQRLKLPFFLEDNQQFCGKVQVIDIGLANEYGEESTFQLIDRNSILPLLVPREVFSHKGNYGHALLMAGGKGMAGAGILSAQACLKSGVGLVSLCVPEYINDIIQIAVPEAMTLNNVANLKLSRYSGIGLGCGLGTTMVVKNRILNLCRQVISPMVFDADALNIIATEKLIHEIPSGSILTPHPGEFDRLFGTHDNHKARIQKQIDKSRQLGIYIVLKTANTSISAPDGTLYFNHTGNPGMAKAGGRLYTRHCR